MMDNEITEYDQPNEIISKLYRYIDKMRERHYKEIERLEFKCDVLAMAVKELHPELYKEIIAEYNKLYPQE